MGQHTFRADDDTPANRSRSAQPIGRAAARRLGICTRCRRPFRAGEYAVPDTAWRSVGLMYRHNPRTGGCR